MFTSFEVENFRGIERLSVDGLGRVNLIIGKNNSGKTALMEAAGALTLHSQVGQWLAFMQELRFSGGDQNTANLDKFWLPLFRNEDAERGFRLKTSCSQAGPLGLWMHRPQGSRQSSVSRAAGLGAVRLADWTLEYEVEERGDSQRFEIKRGMNDFVDYPSEIPPDKHGWWIAASRPPETESIIATFSSLKQQGSDSQVTALLREVDERIEGVELLSPTGNQAAVFARIAGESRLLPFSMMGDGIQRCFDIAVGLASSKVAHLAIDEFENGLHHSVLEPMWRWLAKASVPRGLQVFATTHSEECVQAASRAFSSLEDDGLRVIRLDRQAHQTLATVYDRNLVEAAGRMGVEIRG